MIACYLVRELGLTGREAVLEIRRLRPGSIETHEQEQMAETYYKHLQKKKKQEL